jgi:hypothetical protein
MTITSTPVFVQTPKNGLAQISTAITSSGLVTILTGSSNGTKVSGFIGTTFLTTNAYDVLWGITNNSSTFYLVGTVLMSAGAGSTDSISTVNFMSTSAVPGLTLDSDGNPFIFLKSSLDTLQAKSPATSSTWTTGAVINLVVTAGDF